MATGASKQSAPAQSPLSSREMSLDVAIERAQQALQYAAENPERRSPVAASLALAGRRLGADVHPTDQVAFWESRSPGTSVGEDRYRWELHHTRAKDANWCPPRSDWKTWRPKDQQLFNDRPDSFEERLTVPLSIAESLALLDQLARSRGDDADRARALLAEALPICRRDYAAFAQGAHVWTDTFALFALTSRPRALEWLQPFAIAIAACYVPTAQTDGLLKGQRFPFHKRPLVSASAMLASGLLILGQDLQVLARLAAAMTALQQSNGGWGDDDEPADVFTTYLVAQLLARTDPAFDPLSAGEFLVRQQNDNGFWYALGPEAPWLTDRVLLYLQEASLPFAERFRWPHLPDANRDSKTRLPFYSYFIQLCELFTELPSLGETDCRVAFLDLCGFRAFNNQYGQERGDAVLAELARVLESLPSTVAIRDGGDEFLLVGAPTGGGMTQAVTTFRKQWPLRFRECFGGDAPVVLPRVLTATTLCKKLRATREELGRAVGHLKHESKEPAPWKELGRLS